MNTSSCSSSSRRSFKTSFAVAISHFAHLHPLASGRRHTRPRCGAPLPSGAINSRQRLPRDLQNVINEWRRRPRAAVIRREVGRGGGGARAAAGASAGCEKFYVFQLPKR
ncbi:hypothetical protein EVAR_75669_1 [Eumeta japonica]|uniref:Uncharacterized protein n=1 Tax=Eumeta variegata TaxID=151549 RepID=A0A4C1U0E0_EUMVA|nr:hypothetical protein EVAR_75669_1 [Eumeta japonica]